MRNIAVQPNDHPTDGPLDADHPGSRFASQPVRRWPAAGAGYTKRTWLSCTIFSTLFGLCLLCPASARGQSPAPKVETLIRELGHPEFRKRTQAERQLLELGTSSITLLEESLPQASPEARYRSERLLFDLKRRRAAERLSLLKGSPWMAGGEITDTWERYHRFVDDSEASRALFISMLKAEPQLTMAAILSPREKLEILERRCSELRSLQQISRGAQFSMGTACAVLFISLDSERVISPNSQMMLSSIVRSVASFESNLTDRRVTPPIRSLLASWVGRTDLGTAQYRLEIAYEYEFPEGAAAARELLKEYKSNPSQAHLSIMFLARFGGPDAIQEIESLLTIEDSTQAMTRNRGDGNRVTFTIQVRDIALAALVHMTGQNMEDYGMGNSRADQESVFVHSSLGFADEQSRLHALQRWAEWRARHLQDELKPYTDASEGELG